MLQFAKIIKLTPKHEPLIYHLTVTNNRNYFANNICVHNCDYRGELGVILLNTSNEEYVVNPGEKIAQMVLAKYEKIQWKVTNNLPSTDRGEGGFGSTGIK